jgi:hypothetical protein
MKSMSTRPLRQSPRRSSKLHGLLFAIQGTSGHLLTGQLALIGPSRDESYIQAFWRDSWLNLLAVQVGQRDDPDVKYKLSICQLLYLFKGFS